MKNYQSNYYAAILQEIKRALEDNSITQAEVGDALGIKQSAVSSLLNGKSKLTLEQFLTLSELLGSKPHKVLSSAEVLLTETVPMPYEIESVLYKSEVHLLAYCAATQEITAEDLSIEDYTKEKAKQALEELAQVGVLLKKKDRYIQKNPHITYKATSMMRANAIHQKIVLNAWRMWDKLREKPGYKLRRFNFVLLDRFTVVQIKEVEVLLWKAYERVQAFQRENMAAGYTSEESMPLWNIHLMLTTPLEQK